jgi:hypothetical protein
MGQNQRGNDMDSESMQHNYKRQSAILNKYLSRIFWQELLSFISSFETAKKRV